MGCFLACFGASKNEKHRNIALNVSPQKPNFGSQYKPIPVPTVAAKQDISEKPINLVCESQIKLPQEQLSLTNQGKLEEQLSSGSRKKVTFDSYAKGYEHISAAEASENLHDSKKDVSHSSEKPAKAPSESASGSTSFSLGSYPSSHRYQNCLESDEEEEDLDIEVSDLDEDEEGRDEVGEEVYDEYCDDDFRPRIMQDSSALSRSSMESRTKCPAEDVANDGHSGTMLNWSSPETKNKTPALNRGARNRAGYIHSVLNPVENTTQWKAVKAKGTFSLKQQKENFQMDPSPKQSAVKSKSKTDEPKNNSEVAVDASLSTWLVSSQKTPPVKSSPILSSGASLSSYGSNSIRSQEQRPNMGELKELSASYSLGRSPARSPDEKALIGTVGVHWNERSPSQNSASASSFKGIPNTTSKYREDKRVNWHSTPFETRLERALNKGDADAYAAHHAS